MMCAVASAADSVMVMMKPVAAKPRRQSTSALPRHRGSSFSRIAMLPWPCGLSSATRRYIGSAPKRVRRTRTSVASGERKPGGEKRDPGLVAERREVVDARQAHHLPPGGLVGGRLALGRADALEKPTAERALRPFPKNS